MQSLHIVDMISLCNDDNDVIPLPNVNAVVLTKVIEFLIHFNDAPMTEIQKVCISCVVRVFQILFFTYL